MTAVSSRIFSIRSRTTFSWQTILVIVILMAVFSFSSVWFNQPSSYSLQSYLENLSSADSTVKVYESSYLPITSFSSMTADEYIRKGSLFEVPPDDTPPNIPTPTLSKEDLKNESVANRVSVREQLGYKGNSFDLYTYTEWKNRCGIQRLFWSLDVRLLIR